LTVDLFCIIDAPALYAPGRSRLVRDKAEAMWARWVQIAPV